MTSTRMVARDCLLIFLACFLLHFAGTWALPLCDRDEPRFAEASREMIERGDWVVPFFNNQPRYDKPPLVYWCQATAYRLLGENECHARLPSVLASALTSLALYGFGSRMRNRAVGIWSALVFATCLQTLAHSKLCVADFLMILFFTTASWCAWELSRATESAAPQKPRTRWNWWWGFSVSLGLAFLAKGPIGLLPILFPFAAAAWGKQKLPLRQVRPALAGLVALAIIAAWGVPALVRTHGEFWDVGMGKHVLQRSVGTLEGHGAQNWLQYFLTLPFYFVSVFGSFFPWSIWLVWLVRRMWKRRAPLVFDELFLLSGALVVFVIFSFVRTKLPHYTLPAFPLLSLLLVREWELAGTSLRWPRNLAAGTTALALTVFVLGFPSVARFFPSADLARQCAPVLKPEMELASSSYTEASLCWNFRKHIRGFHESMKVSELPAFMAQPGPRVCVLPTASVATNFPNLPADWRRFETKGINLAKGRWVELTALVKTTE